MAEKIMVEVAYALPEQQRIVEVEVDAGTVAFDAAVQSGITKFFPDLELETAKMGIFGKAIKAKTHELQAGDRVEIYRALQSDPKASRKARADKAKAAKQK